MKSRGRGPQLAQEILEEEEEEKTAWAVSHLSSHGISFRGKKGEYEVTTDGTVVRSPLLKPPPLELRCNYTDLDINNGRLLGSGASGKVYAVKHIPTETWIALKKINVDDEQHLQQIQRELDMLLSGSNANVVAFHGAFLERGLIMIALELMDGCLLDAVKHMRTIPEHVLRGVTCQVLKGLAYLHKERHVVHRDLKPSNILFSRDGSIKITDFGIAATLQSSLMQADTFIGTILYMSPERLSGGNYSYPADVWALGLTLVILATGTHPYAKLEEQANFWHVLKVMGEEDPPTLPPDGPFSAVFRAFLALCVHLAPEQRASVPELLAHPFIADMPAEDERGVCRQWFPEVRCRMNAADSDHTAEAKLIAHLRTSLPSE